MVQASWAMRWDWRSGLHDVKHFYQIFSEIAVVNFFGEIALSFLLGIIFIKISYLIIIF